MAFQLHCERPDNGKIWELVSIGDVVVDKSKNEPGSLQAVFLRDTMTVEVGDIIAVQLDDRGMDDFNLFYGYVYKTSKYRDEVTVTAYDQLYALKLSKEIKNYGDIKLSDLYIQISDEHKLFMLNPPNVKDSEYVVPEVIADGSSPIDLLTETANSTYKATGKQYYFFDFFKNLCLEEAEDYKVPKEEYELTSENMKSYSYEEDGSERINEVIIKSDDGNNTILAVRRDEESIDRYGAITYSDKIKDGENADAIADQYFQSKRVIAPKMNVSVYGCNPQVVPGRLVHVDIFTTRHEFICGWFTVESCTYTLSEGSGNMDLKLSLYWMESELFGS